MLPAALLSEILKEVNSSPEGKKCIIDLIKCISENFKNIKRCVIISVMI